MFSSLTMATATTAHNFTWQFTNRIKPARTIKSSSSFPSLTRAISFGSPTFPRRKPSPIRRKSKSVHFADSKGLALVSVLTFNEEQELREQFSRLANLTQTAAGRHRSRIEYASCKSKKSNGTHSKKISDKITKQLAWQKVYVEKAELIKGNIRSEVYVVNLAYEKHVKARFTLDSWQTYEEIDGKFHSNCTKDIDKFVVEIPVPKHSAVKNFKIEFAVSYTVLGDTFWDNNNGLNYHALCTSHN